MQGTLEWLDSDTFAARSVPYVTSREPLWDQPGLKEAVKSGRCYLPGALTGQRETIVTSAIEAEPQYLLQTSRPRMAPCFGSCLHRGVFSALDGEIRDARV